MRAGVAPERRRTIADETALNRGFLPEADPLVRFEPGSPFEVLDALGHDLPSRLYDGGFRSFARQLQLPPPRPEQMSLGALRLYCVRLGFLASAYVNQVGQEPATLLPRSIAVPLCDVCRLLNRPPILSYDGYALFNWKRFDPAAPIVLGNIDTIQNFVHLYDEHWFILVHVHIEALAARIVRAIEQAAAGAEQHNPAQVHEALVEVGQTLWAQVGVLRRIPQHMDPALYYKTFRPYIRLFEGVVYEGVNAAPMDFRGETGAQSSVIPMVVAFLKVPHRPSMLTDHLADMRRFMPAPHRAYLERVEALPDLRPMADKHAYNDCLEALATFRETHLEFARRYIAQWVTDPRGTGGTPYMHWLAQLIQETREHKIA